MGADFEDCDDAYGMATGENRLGGVIVISFFLFISMRVLDLKLEVLSRLSAIMGGEITERVSEVSSTPIRWMGGERFEGEAVRAVVWSSLAYERKICRPISIEAGSRSQARRGYVTDAPCSKCCQLHIQGQERKRTCLLNSH